MKLVQKKIIIFGNLYSKKNSKRIIRVGGKTKILPSDAYQNALPEVVSQLRDPDNKDIWTCMLFDNYKMNGTVNPIHLNFKIFRKSKHKFDFINIIQGLCDILQEEEYLQDDDANHLVPYFLSNAIDKQNPRVELSIHNTNQSINTQDYD